MKLILNSIFLILLFVNSSRSINQRKFGPWFPATEGEPWPVPWKRIMGNNSLILRSLSFKIEVRFQKCSSQRKMCYNIP